MTGHVLAWLIFGCVAVVCWTVVKVCRIRHGFDDEWETARPSIDAPPEVWTAYYDACAAYYDACARAAEAPSAARQADQS